MSSKALTADQLVEALKATDWNYSVQIDTEPRREITSVEVEECEGDPAFRIMLKTQPISE